MDATCDIRGGRARHEIPDADPIPDHAGAIDWNKPPLALTELQLANARLAGENSALRAKCARLSATVDELIIRLAEWQPHAETKPLAGHEPVCRNCGSADMRHGHADRTWRCHCCGQVTGFPLLRCVREPKRRRANA